jgi:cell division protein FtsL
MQSGQLDSQRNAQIASLGIERTTLSRKVDNWNNGMLFALGLTVLAAFVVFWTTRMTNLRSKQLTAVQDRLNTLNDEQANANNLQLERDLSAQRERTAIAEAAVLELQIKVRGREITSDQIARMKAMGNGREKVVCPILYTSEIVSVAQVSRA